MLIGGQATGVNAALRIRLEANRFLEVGEHVVDVDTLRLLTRPGERLTPKAAAVLMQLARAGGRTLSRDELLNEVWKGTCPTPDVLTQAVKDLRRALGDDLHAPRFVETLPRLGYRLVAPARFLDQYGESTAKPARVETALVSSVAPVVETARRKWIAPAAWTIAALVVLALATLGARTWFDGSVAAKAHWQASEQRAITSDPGPENFPRISPDGTRIAYSIGADRHQAHIVQRALTQSRVVPLTDASEGEESYPVWSPDGATIAFVRLAGDDCKIWLAPALGGPERLLDSCFAGAANYFSWAPDAKHLITTAPSSPNTGDMAITLVAIDGGSRERLLYDHGVADLDLDARYSPDGNQIAFRRGASPYSDLFVVEARGGPIRQLTHLASRIRGFDWTRDGTALVFSSGHSGTQALYTVSIADGHVETLGVQPAQYPSAARASDTVVYEIPRTRTQLGGIAIGASENAPHEPAQRELVPSTGNDGAPSFSPIDDRLAFVSDRSGTQQLWLSDPSSNETYPLTESDEPTLRYPVWRPDGARLLVTARNASHGRLVEVDIATRTRRVLSADDDDVRYGVYGSRPDSYIAVVGSDEVRELVEFDNTGGTATSRRVLARDVGRVDYDPGDSTIYFTRASEPGLYRLDPQSGIESLVTRSINHAHLDAWLVSAGDIFYIETQAVGPDNLRELDPGSGDDRVIATLPGSLADFDFSVSRDRKQIAVVRIAAEDTDVGAITLRRGNAG